MNDTAGISAIITVFPKGSTVADLDVFLATADRFSLGDGADLIDGTPAGPPPASGLPATPEARTLGELRTWAAALHAAGAAPDLEIVGLADLGVDLGVVAVEIAGCGEHVGVEPALVVVQTDPRCAEHAPTAAATGRAGATGTVG